MKTIPGVRASVVRQAESTIATVAKMLRLAVRLVQSEQINMLFTGQPPPPETVVRNGRRRGRLGSSDAHCTPGTVVGGEAPPAAFQEHDELGGVDTHTLSPQEDGRGSVEALGPVGVCDNQGHGHARHGSCSGRADGFSCRYLIRDPFEWAGAGSSGPPNSDSSSAGRSEGQQCQHWDTHSRRPGHVSRLPAMYICVGIRHCRGDCVLWRVQQAKVRMMQQGCTAGTNGED